VEWWTFAGGRANACLAAGLEQRAGHPASFDNFTVRFKATAQAAAAAGAIDALRTAPVDDLLPQVDLRAIDGLKFSACLPPPTASNLVGTRLHDGAAMRAIFTAPMSRAHCQG
jgi:ATP-dependent Lhr-like helicase